MELGLAAVITKAGVYPVVLLPMGDTFRDPCGCLSLWKH